MVIFGQNGEQDRVAAMPTIANASMLLAGFDAQGKGPFASFITSNQSGGIVKTETFQFNNESGQLVKQTQPVNLFFGSIPDKLATLKVSTEPIPGLSSAMEKTMMWLDFPQEKAKARIQVTTDGQTPVLAPHQTALAYKHLGALVVRRIASISPGFYQRMVSKEHKENAEHICQSIATALKQLKSSGFAGLPTAMQWEEYATRVNIAPMLREAFSYQYAGEPILDGDLAARQIVGIVSTPSGRAVLYADMHILWEPSH